jgi:hypothetical protein
MPKQQKPLQQDFFPPEKIPAQVPALEKIPAQAPTSTSHINWDDVIFWKPKAGEEIEGEYLGFSQFESLNDSMTDNALIHTGNGEVFVMPSWFALNRAFANALSGDTPLKVGDRVKVQYHGKRDLKGGTTMAQVSLIVAGAEIPTRKISSGRDIVDRLLG